MENLTGKLVDRYQILDLLGKGGMAMVYKAYDPRLEREVAIKIIRLEAFPPEELHGVLKRFEREAKALARLSHPNIVKVLDYGEFEGSPFLVLEYLPGGTLKHRVGESISWQEAMRLVLPVARGLEYAHLRGIVHRDIKPANILLTENGEPTLSDFGIAKLLQGEKTATLTGTGAAVGTPEYMAPEQWTGETTAKSDMYSLGVVLYEIITGQRPYVADTPGGIFLKQVTEPLPLPRNVVPDLPESVERFLLKVLSKEPSERYEDLGAFVRELESLFRATSVQTRPVEPESGPESGKPVKDIKAEADRVVVEEVSHQPASEVSAHPTARWPRPNRYWVSVAVVGVMVLLALIIGVPKIQGILSALPVPTKGNVGSESSPSAPEFSPSNQTPFPVTDLPTSVVTPTQIPFTPTPDLRIGSSWTRPADGMVMMYVPDGKFLMGSEDGDSDQQPVHSVYLDSYWIDESEVTNAMYLTCLEAESCPDPGDQRQLYAKENPNHPAEGTWYMAKAYCDWVEARLPTEAEWEKAARGGLQSMSYPWGNETPTCQAGTKNGARWFDCGLGSGAPYSIEVKTFAPNGYGLYDTTGNVWEWVADWYDPEYYKNSPSDNPNGPTSGNLRVMRGGSWAPPLKALRVAFRIGADPMGNSIGFRCARDTTP